MRAVLVVLLVLVGCDRTKDAGPARGAGSGSGSSGMVARPPADAAVAAGCDLTGDYRLRVSANGADGWWLALSIAGTPPVATITHELDVLDLVPGPIATTVAGCAATLTTSTKVTGALQLAITLDPKTGAVTGELARATGGGDSYNAPSTTRVTGRRDVGGIGGPACLKPGVYKLEIVNTRWKLAHGTPRVGSCKDFADRAHAFVRIQPFGDEIAIDATEPEPPYHQGFERATVTRTGDCQLGVKLAIQDFDFDGTVTLAGDHLAGTAAHAHYQFMEDGEAGENLWGCRATGAPLVGARVAD